MPYFHVMIWPMSAEQQTLRELYALNLSEDELRERILTPYEQGQPITSGGRTLPGGDIATITITQSDNPLQVPRFQQYEALSSAPEVTDAFITGPPGEAATEARPRTGERADPRRVMVVHGRNARKRRHVHVPPEPRTVSD